MIFTLTILALALITSGQVSWLTRYDTVHPLVIAAQAFVTAWLGLLFCMTIVVMGTT